MSNKLKISIMVSVVIILSSVIIYGMSIMPPLLSIFDDEEVMKAKEIARKHMKDTYGMNAMIISAEKDYGNGGEPFRFTGTVNLVVSAQGKNYNVVVNTNKNIIGDSVNKDKLIGSYKVYVKEYFGEDNVEVGDVKLAYGAYDDNQFNIYSESNWCMPPGIDTIQELVKSYKVKITNTMNISSNVTEAKMKEFADQFDSDSFIIFMRCDKPLVMVKDTRYFDRQTYYIYEGGKLNKTELQSGQQILDGVKWYPSVASGSKEVKAEILDSSNTDIKESRYAGKISKVVFVTREGDKASGGIHISVSKKVFHLAKGENFGIYRHDKYGTSVTSLWGYRNEYYFEDAENYYFVLGSGTGICVIK